MIKRLIIILFLLISAMFWGISTAKAANDTYCYWENGKHKIEIIIHPDFNSEGDFDVNDIETIHTLYTIVKAREVLNKGNSPYCPKYVMRNYVSNGTYGEGYTFTFSDTVSGQYELLYTLSSQTKKPAATTTTTTAAASPEPVISSSTTTTTTTKAAAAAAPSSPEKPQVQQRAGYNDSPELRDVCESSGFLQILMMVVNIVNILKVLVPLILIAMLIKEIYPLISNPNEVKKVIASSKNRIIAAILIFLVPTIIDIVLGALGDTTSVSKCYANANTEHIELRKAAEKEIFKTTEETPAESTIQPSNNGDGGGGRNTATVTPEVTQAAVQSAKTKWNSSYVDTSNKSYNKVNAQNFASQSYSTIDVSYLSVPMYNYAGTQYKTIMINSSIEYQFKNILANIADFVRDNPDLVSQFQASGAYVGGDYGSGWNYHAQGFAIDLFDHWCYQNFCPYGGQGVGTWQRYITFVCQVCDGHEDCPYNLNYIIYKKYFQGNKWCWGGNWSPNDFDPMHFEVRNDGGCLTQNKQKIVC